MGRRVREDRDTTSGRIRGSTPELIEAARKLRKRMTPAEEVLWQALRGQRLAGLRFRRQHPIGPYVLDFAYPERLLAIELDGGIHREQVGQDAARTATLETYGWYVIRIPNERVFSDLPTVLSAIEAVAFARPIARGWNTGATSNTNESPSPNVGGGVGVGAT
jgi:very-short-patch-repair endonuclease